MYKLKKCKQCDKTGFFLKLNANGLCQDCQKDNSQIINLSLEQTADVLATAVKTGNNKTLKKFQQSIDAQERISKRKLKNFNVIFKAYQKARELEKKGQPKEALEIYLDLIVYRPPGTDYYIRPCIILEKQKEYRKAIDICEIAITEISSKSFNADPNEFHYRIERLEKKLNKQN